MSRLKFWVLVLALAAWAGAAGNTAFAMQDSATQESGADAVAAGDRLDTLPQDIQERIKSRKRAIIKTRKDIRSLSPEGKAELQASIEEWFKALPLEKQVEIKIRMGGGAPDMDQFKQIENSIAQEAEAKKEEIKPAISAPEAAPTPAPEAAPEAAAATPDIQTTAEPVKETTPAPEAPATEATPAPAEQPKQEESKAPATIQPSSVPETTPASLPESEKATLENKDTGKAATPDATAP